MLEGERLKRLNSDWWLQPELKLVISRALLREFFKQKLKFENKNTEVIV